MLIQTLPEPRSFSFMESPWRSLVEMGIEDGFVLFLEPNSRHRLLASLSARQGFELEGSGERMSFSLTFAS
jgi:hypothetical protein